MEVKLKLEGLHCANCARKIELQVQALQMVEKATLNFATVTLMVTVSSTATKELTIQEIKKIVAALEPHVVVNEIGQKPTMSQLPKPMLQKFLTICYQNIYLLVGTLVLLVAIITNMIGLYIVSYLLIGFDVIKISFQNMRRGVWFDEHFLMMIATLGAFAIGEVTEAVAVMLFYKIGESFQRYAVDKSRETITSLLSLQVEEVTVIRNQEKVVLKPEEVVIGDIMMIKAGERLALDGEVIDGSGFVDTSAVTGESVQRRVDVGQKVLSGFVNQTTILYVVVQSRYEDSTICKMLELTELAASRKAKTEQFMTKFAAIYTPIVVGIALLIAITPSIMTFEFMPSYVYRALLFLVISCPCAIVLSIPLTIFAGLGGAAKKGILIKGGNYLEALSTVETIVLDKTGTITKGNFKVTDYQVLSLEDSIFKYLIKAIETYSTHPIATSILQSFTEDVSSAVVKGYEEIVGFGVRGIVDGKIVLFGNSKLMEAHNVTYQKIETAKTVLYLSVDYQYSGYVIISDEIKETSAEAIALFKAQGVKQVVMLTGDQHGIAHEVGEAVNVDVVYSELLPQDKVSHLEALLKTKKGHVLAVGDGLNDAPLLARADIGVAMGGIGSDASLEAADVIIMNDNLMGVAQSLRKAKEIRLLLFQNISFALAVKLIVMLLGVCGFASMWAAVFADVGVTLLVVLNSIRGLK